MLILVLVWCVSHSSVLGDTFEASKAFVSDGSTAASAQCSLYIVYPRNLSHPLRTAPDLHFRCLAPPAPLLELHWEWTACGALQLYVLYILALSCNVCMHVGLVTCTLSVVPRACAEHAAGARQRRQTRW